MEATKPSNQSEMMKKVSELAELAMQKASNSANAALKKGGFVPEYRSCEVHGRYQINVETENGTRFLPAHCPVCFEQRKAGLLLKSSNIPERFAECTFDNYLVKFGEKQEKVLSLCRSFAEKFAEKHESGACLLLCGKPGTGKNHLATAICKLVMKSGYSVLRVKASQYLDTFWSKGFDDREKWLGDIAKVDLLFIDEIGRSSETKNAQDAFFRLIDARYEAVLPAIIATNLNRKELMSVLGDAAYERLAQGGSLRLTLDWDSYRLDQEN